VWKSTNPGIAPKLPVAPATVAPAPVVPEPPAVDQPTIEHPAVRQRPSSAALLSTDRPTTAPSPADYRRTDVMPHPSQVRPPVRQQSHVAAPPLVPARPQPMGTSPVGNPATRTAPPGRKPMWLFASLGMLVVLAAIIGGAWWLSTTSGDSQNVAQPQPTSPTDVALEDRLPTLPGTPNPNNSTMALSKGPEFNLFPSEAIPVFRQHGASEVVFRGSHDDEGNAYFVLAIPAADHSGASAVASYLLEGGLTGGFTQLPDRPSVVSGVKDGRRMQGTWYASEEVAITLWVSQPETAESAALNQNFDQALNSLQKALPEE
jgi:hypothetical protein